MQYYLYTISCRISLTVFVHHFSPLVHTGGVRGSSALHQHGRIEHEFIGAGRGRGPRLGAVADVVGQRGGGRERRRHRQVRRRRRATVEAGRRRSRRKSVDGNDDVLAVDF